MAEKGTNLLQGDALSLTETSEISKWLSSIRNFKPYRAQAMFAEAKHPKRWILSTFAIFFFLTIPNSWLPELNHDEALYAVIAKEQIDNGDYFITHAQRNPSDISALIPWILSGIFRVLPTNEFTIRLVGIIPLGGLAALCGFIGFRSAGPRAGGVAAVAASSSYMALKQGVLAEENMLFCLLINASWLVWYVFGRGHHKWLYAWFFAHILVFGAIMTVGFKAIFFFYFPLFFLRRPLKIWLRLRQADHLLSAGVLFSFVIFWLVITPHQMEKVVNFFQQFEHREASSSYFLHLLTFPVESILSFSPWLFLAWPAYCMAFQPLEKDPILGKFLRTITFSLFYFFWFFPEFRPRILTPLIGPLSILIGLNYDILIRRYGNRLLLLPGLISWITLIGITICGIVAMTKFGSEPAMPRHHFFSFIIFSAIAGILAIIVLKARLNLQIWFSVALSIVAFRLAFTSAFSGLCTYDSLSEKRNLSQQLSKNLPLKTVIYEMVDNKKYFPGESYYLNRPVVKINDLLELPRYQNTVFLLNGDQMPISRNRNWFPVSELVHYKEYRLRIWKGEKRTISSRSDL